MLLLEIIKNKGTPRRCIVTDTVSSSAPPNIWMETIGADKIAEQLD